MSAIRRWRIPGQMVSRTCAGAAAMALSGAVTGSHAQPSAWRPQKTVEIVIPSSAGSSMDAAARMIQGQLQEGRIVDVPVVAVNKSGGGGNLATNYLDQQAGDGHFMFFSTMSLMNSHILGRSKTNYTDYTPIALVFTEDMTIVVQADSALKTGRDIMARLKDNPESLAIAIGLARGGTGHLNIALVTKTMGIDARKLKTVIFDGNVKALAALLGGHVDLSSMSFAQARAQSQQGKLRIVGVAAERRGEGVLTNIPTWKEQGFDVVFTNVRLMFGPKGMTPAQTAYWDAALQRMLQSDRWKKFAEDNHYVQGYVGPERAPQHMAALYKQLKDALVEVGMAKQ